MLRLTFVSGFALAFWGGCPADAQPFELRTIVLKGEESPGAPGFVFDQFTRVNLGQDGRIGFRASTLRESPRERIARVYMAGPGGELTLVASDGDDAPSGVGEIDSVATPLLANSGDLAIPIGLRGGRSAVLVGRPGDLRFAAIEGGGVSGAADIPEIGSTSFSPAGVFAIQSRTSNDREIWAGPAGSIERVIEARMQAPGYPDGAYIASAGFTRVDGSGQTVSLAEIRGAGYDGERIEVVADADRVRIVGGPPTSPDQLGVVSGGSVPTTRSDGTIAFSALYRENRDEDPVESSMVGLPGDLRVVTRRGDPAPLRDRAATFADLNSTILSSRDDVAVHAMALDDKGEFFEGVWLETNTGMVPLAIEGDQIANREGATLLDFESHSSSRGIGMMSGGTVAFLGNQLNPSGDFAAALIIADTTSLRTVVAVGDDIEVGQGDIRTVQGIEVRGSRIAGELTGLNNDDGWGGFFNDSRELVLVLDFADSSTGVFSVVVPSPATVAVLTAGVFYGRRRSR